MAHGRRQNLDAGGTTTGDAIRRKIGWQIRSFPLCF